MCGLRVWQLETVPPGFYIDEAGGATNVICIAEDGTSEAGIPHPLYFPDFDVGGLFTPTYVYFGAIWVKVFGTSIESFRAIAAFFTLLTIIGLFKLSSALLDTKAATLVALAASISPWSFQFSRIAWDPPLMPCFLVWGCFYFIQRRFWHAAVSGILFSLALYSYPAARLQLPLILPLLVAFKFFSKKFSPKEDQNEQCSPLLFCGVTFLFVVVTSIPLVTFTLNGLLGKRIVNLSIFNKTYSGGTYLGVLKLFFENVLAHLSPRYLFWSGDANLRHSTGLFGEMSWLDDYALLLAFGLRLGFLTPAAQPVRRYQKRDQRLAKAFTGLLVFSLWGFIAGILPAALTWEGIPHALRSIGSWPFLSLFTGIVIWRGCGMSRVVSHCTVIISFVFALLFGYSYFIDYPVSAKPWFDANVKEAAMEAKRTGNWSGFAQSGTAAGYASVSLRYYMIHYGGMSCAQTRAIFRQ